MVSSAHSQYTYMHRRSRSFGKKDVLFKNYYPQNFIVDSGIVDPNPLPQVSLSLILSSLSLSFSPHLIQVLSSCIIQVAVAWIRVAAASLVLDRKNPQEEVW